MECRRVLFRSVDAVLLLIAKQPSSRTPYRSGAIAQTAIAADACANHPDRPLFSAPQLRNDTPLRFWRTHPCPLLRSAEHVSNRSEERREGQVFVSTSLSRW